MITGIHHFALVTTDPERAARFYVDLLGFHDAGRLQPPGGNTIIFVSLDGARIEIFGGGKPRDPGESAFGAGTVGYTHLALSTDNVVEEAARLRSHGVKFLVEPREVEPGFWIAFFEDPDGNPVEIFQRRE